MPPLINITSPTSEAAAAGITEKSFLVKFPHAADLIDEAITVTSRPGSPLHHPRKGGGGGGGGKDSRLEGGYFDSKRE